MHSQFLTEQKFKKSYAPFLIKSALVDSKNTKNFKSQATFFYFSACCQKMRMLPVKVAVLNISESFPKPKAGGVLFDDIPCLCFVEIHNSLKTHSGRFNELSSPRAALFCLFCQCGFGSPFLCEPKPPKQKLCKKGHPFPFPNTTAKNTLMMTLCLPAGCLL